MFLLDTEKKITSEGLKKISSGLLPRGTLLLSSRAPIGYLALTNIECAINQGYIAMKDNAYFSNIFMYFWLKANMQLVKNSSNGSTFMEISKASFKNINCIIPELNVINLFKNTANPLIQKILLNTEQIRLLERKRDTILPKLMSGEIRVKGFGD